MREPMQFGYHEVSPAHFPFPVEGGRLLRDVTLLVVTMDWSTLGFIVAQCETMNQGGPGINLCVVCVGTSLCVMLGINGVTVDGKLLLFIVLGVVVKTFSVYCNCSVNGCCVIFRWNYYHYFIMCSWKGNLNYFIHVYVLYNI